VPILRRKQVRPAWDHALSQRRADHCLVAVKIVESNNDATGKPGCYYGKVNDLVVRVVPAESRRILDVGCGAGALGVGLKARFGPCEMTGIELVAEAAEHAKRRYKQVVVGNVEQMLPLPFPDGSFDCVVFGDVLEHLDSPEPVLEGAKRVLTDDGSVVACLPNVAHWSVVMALLRGHFDYADAGILDVTHKRFFTPATFAEMATRTGWRIEECHRRPLECPAELKEAFCTVGRLFGQEDSWTGLLVDTYQHVHVMRKA
jgi:2-polyprenyl-3-methyl-5-hydroxy-6-metoxy-1,4-benzoquinol methylase